MSFELIVGYDDAAQFKDSVESFISGCDNCNVFFNAVIGVPTFEMTDCILSFLPDKNIMNLNKDVVCKVINGMFEAIPEKNRIVLIDTVTVCFDFMLKDRRLNSTVIKNSFVRVIYSLHTFFIEFLKGFNKAENIFFEGTLNKYDFLVFNVLCSFGANIMLVFLDYKKIDFLTKPLFSFRDGRYKTKLDFKLLDVSTPPANININDWLNFSGCSDIDDHVNLLLQNSENRFKNGYNVVFLKFSGVLEKQKYEFAVNRFYLSVKSKGQVFVIDDSFSNPTYDEIQKFNEKQYSSKAIGEILNGYVCFCGTSFPDQFKKSVDYLILKNQFNSDSKKKNFEMVLGIWLTRICNEIFYDNMDIDYIPVIIVWGEIQSKIADFLYCLRSLPVDIIQFSPNDESENSFEWQKVIPLGRCNSKIEDFPYELKRLSKHETVAFQAEREIRDVLTSGTTTFYQMKQFRELNPIILKTTFEEIDIMWKEPAKFRPAFGVSGDTVTIPSIFAKINGVKDSVENYVASIQEKITTETVLMDKFPFMPVCADTSILSFLKQVCFRDHIDMEKIKVSKYYNYGLFSEETQNVIIKGIIDFIKNGRYAEKQGSFIYNVLEVLLRLPHNVVQLVHNFNFTESIPKVIVFNSKNIPCSEEDCIFIMFLKSLGFDVVVYVPTGYRVIEEHISDSLFNNINIGPYRFDLSNVDLTKRSFFRKKGIWGKLFT